MRHARKCDCCYCRRQAGKGWATLAVLFYVLMVSVFGWSVTTSILLAAVFLFITATLTPTRRTTPAESPSKAPEPPPIVTEAAKPRPTSSPAPTRYKRSPAVEADIVAEEPKGFDEMLEEICSKRA